MSRARAKNWLKPCTSANTRCYLAKKHGSPLTVPRMSVGRTAACVRVGLAMGCNLQCPPPPCDQRPARVFRRFFKRVAPVPTCDPAARGYFAVPVRYALPFLHGIVILSTCANSILHDDRHTNAQIRKEDGYTPRTADSRDSDDAPLDWDALGSHPGAGSSLAFMRFAPPLMVAGKPFITNPDLVHSLLVGAKDLLHADPRSMEVRAVYGGRLMLVCMRKKRWVPQPMFTWTTVSHCCVCERDAPIVCLRCFRVCCMLPVRRKKRKKCYP